MSKERIDLNLLKDGVVNLFQRNFFRSLLGLSCGALLANTVYAGPPYQTDDPEPVDIGEHELYIAYEQARTHAGNASSLPLIELNYGAAKNLQIGIGVPFVSDNPRDESSHYGRGDVELSAKYRFIEETSERPMISFFPMLALPTGDADKALGNGKLQVFLPVWLQKNWGEWQVNTGGGYLINHANEARNHWYFGWQTQKHIDEQWTLGAEIFHTTEEVSGEGSSSGFNVGAVYALDEHNHLLLSAGRGLSNIQTTNEFSTYVGYQLNW